MVVVARWRRRFACVSRVEASQAFCADFFLDFRGFFVLGLPPPDFFASSNAPHDTRAPGEAILHK